MQNTVDDFWRMIWEQQSKVVLMLTHLFENGVVSKWSLGNETREDLLFVCCAGKMCGLSSSFRSLGLSPTLRRLPSDSQEARSQGQIHHLDRAAEGGLDNLYKPKLITLLAEHGVQQLERSDTLLVFGLARKRSSDRGQFAHRLLDRSEELHEVSFDRQSTTL
jgi:hypothetical protein